MGSMSNDNETELAPAPEGWWRDHDNVVLLAYWMKEHGHSADDFVVLIEKPWKFEDEFMQAKADHAAEEAAAERKQTLEQEFKAGFDEGRPA